MLTTLAQNDDGGAAGSILGAVFGCGCGLLYLAVVVVVIAGGWKVFAKAGKPGWAVIVPIYNLIVILEITGRPIWWVLLMFIPFVNIVVGIIIALDMAKAFGKSPLFGVGLILLPMIFYPILGFGDAKYLGPVAKPAGT